MIRAMDRGRQLIRSMGLAIDSSDEALSPSQEQDATESIPHPPPINPTVSKEQAVSRSARRTSYSHSNQAA